MRRDANLFGAGDLSRMAEVLDEAFDLHGEYVGIGSIAIEIV